MVQILAYFEHVQIALKIEPMKTFARDDKTTQFFLTQQHFIHYHTPNVHVNMVGGYHGLDGERTMHHQSKSSNLAQHVSQGVWLKGLEKFEN